MTNMSSIPIPRQRKGRMACRGVKGKPRAELREGRLRWEEGVMRGRKGPREY